MPLWPLWPLQPSALPALRLRETPTTQTRSFSAEQTGDIEKIVHDYLLKHPEVLIEAMQELDKKQAASDREKQDSAVAANRAAIFNDADSYVAGNPKGDVTIVEFLRLPVRLLQAQASAPLMDTLKKDGNIRLVLKEFPILGEESVTATRAAVASMKQGKYFEFPSGVCSITRDSLPMKPSCRPPPMSDSIPRG